MGYIAHTRYFKELMISYRSPQTYCEAVDIYSFNGKSAFARKQPRRRA